MTLNTSKSNHLTPLRFKGLKVRLRSLRTEEIKLDGFQNRQQNKVSLDSKQSD